MDASEADARTKPFLMTVHELGFDVDRLLSDYQRIIDENLGGEAGSGATIVNFTHRPGAADPFRDGAETQYDLTTGRRRFAEAEFSTFNDQLKDTGFYELYQKLPFTVGRMRVRSLAPGKAMTMHADTSPRAHVALVTNPFCYLTTADGQMHHVPADGNVYVFDTRLEHTAFNASEQPRLQLAIALADQETRFA